MQRTPRQEKLRQVRILIFEPYLLKDFKIYGNTRYLLSIFKYIDHSRFKVFLGSPIKSNISPIIEGFGGHCVQLMAPSKMMDYGGQIMNRGYVGRMAVLVSIIGYTFRLASFLIRENIDIVQCHSIRAVLTIGFAARMTFRPVIFYIKGLLENPLLDWIGFEMATKILFQNETNMQCRYPHLILKHRCKIQLLKNGIDFEDIQAARNKAGEYLKSELGLKGSSVKIMYMGILSPLKGLIYLLEAMLKVWERCPEAHLYIAGHHEIDSFKGYQTELFHFISKNRMENIHFLGYRQDALAVLSLMDIYVLPSLSEGVPKSIIEAMALGKPVIATNVGGIPELVREGQTGYLVEPRDSEGLAQSIIKLAINAELRSQFGKRGHEIAFQEYSIEDNIRGLKNIYEEMAAFK
jgi:glycosyltransferase involved in cell wall biosynthesis